MIIPIAIAVLGTAAASAAQRDEEESDREDRLKERLSGPDTSRCEIPPREHDSEKEIERQRKIIRCWWQLYGGGRTISYDDLPAEAKSSLVWQSDGTDYYGDPDETRERYKDVGLALFRVPMSELVRAVCTMIYVERDFGGDFEAYRRWYTKGEPPGSYAHKSSRYESDDWPVILHEWSEEFMLDGWHRFHTYYGRGNDSVPVLITGIDRYEVEPGSTPGVGQRVGSGDYGGQPWLYHATARSNLESILEHGLIPGHGTALGSSVKDHASDRVFFSTQPDKWLDPGEDHVLLRVETDSVRCLYDGGEWLHDGDDETVIEGRLADCYTTRTVRPELVEVVDDRQPEDDERALIIVHLSSLDSFGSELNQRVKEAIIDFDGLVIVLDQDWEDPPRDRQRIYEAMLHRDGPIIVQWHDEDCSTEDLPEPFDDAWEWLESWLPAMLRENDIEDVTLGGAWWFRDGTSGCVNGVEDILQSWLETSTGGGFLKSVTVDESLVGEDEAGDHRLANPPEGEAKTALLLRAAKILRAYDPEMFDGGCNETAAVLEQVARQLGIPGVVAVYGNAWAVDPDSPEWKSVLEQDPFWLPHHAWLEVDGQVFDPSWKLQGLVGARYENTGDTREDRLDWYDREDWWFWVEHVLREIEKPEKGIPAITTSKLLYHGTSAHQLERLKASGWNAGLIYLSSNPDEANGYADRKVEQDEMDDGVDPEDNDSVMLSLNLDILERTGELMPDWDDMQSAWSLGEIDRPPDQVSWSESLDFGNTCSYTGPLEEAIVKVERWS